MPTKETSTEASPANAINISCSKTLESQDLLYNTGKMPNNSSGNSMSLLPSKFKFRKTNSSQSALRVGPENPGSHCGTGIALRGLEGSKNQVDVTLHSKPENTKPPFKRHLSESLVLPTSGACLQY